MLYIAYLICLLNVKNLKSSVNFQYNYGQLFRASSTIGPDDAGDATDVAHFH